MPGRMLTVELVEEPGPDRARRPAATPRRAHPALRRAARRVATLAAAALAVSLFADAQLDHARAAALADVPGLLRPLGTGLRPLWEADPATAAALAGGAVVDGTLVGVAAGPGGATELVGLDPGSGARRWATPVPPGPAAPPGPTATDCLPAGALAVCRAVSSGAAGAQWRPVWVVDPADGRLVDVRELPWNADVAVVGGLVVTVRWLRSDGTPPELDGVPDAARLVATDPATGAVAWTWTSPSVAARNTGWWASAVTGDAVFVARSDRGWLLGPDGRVRRDVAVRGAGRYVATRAGGLVQVRYGLPGHGLLLRDDDTWRAVSGVPLDLAADDGSAPGLVPLVRGGTRPPLVTAVDGATGDERWRVPVRADAAALLDGRLYLAGDRLVALDAATGGTAWSTPLERPATALATDGRVLLVAGSGAGVEAFDVRDGRPVWRVGGAALAAATGARAGVEVTLGGRAGLVRVTRPDGSAVVLG